MPTQSKPFLEVYREKHRHPVNKVLHTLGIPMIVVSLGLVFFDWRWGVGLFILGWILQFLGHLFGGPVWWVKKLFARRGSKF